MILRKFSVLLLILLSGSSPLFAQSMSDSQVLEYVKDGIRQGKEQKQLASELARKGVTKEQALRVKQLYEQQNNAWIASFCAAHCALVAIMANQPHNNMRIVFFIGLVF